MKSSYVVDVQVNYTIYDLRTDKLDACVEGNDEIIHISDYLYMILSMSK